MKFLHFSIILSFFIFFFSDIHGQDAHFLWLENPGPYTDYEKISIDSFNNSFVYEKGNSCGPEVELGFGTIITHKDKSYVSFHPLDSIDGCTIGVNPHPDSSTFYILESRYFMSSTQLALLDKNSKPLETFYSFGEEITLSNESILNASWISIRFTNQNVLEFPVSKAILGKKVEVFGEFWAKNYLYTPVSLISPKKIEIRKRKNGYLFIENGAKKKFNRLRK